MAINTETRQPQPRAEAIVNLAELIALKSIPDRHAMPLKLYAGGSGPKPFAEWMSLYKEMLGKPTGMTREEWHTKFIKGDN
jgi:hypothetical protein